MSLGGESDVGQRTERCRGKSVLSGEYVVEDVTVNGEVYRRLIFFNNPKLIQSEARILIKGQKKKKIVDKTYLACAHHSVMIGSLGFFLDSKDASVGMSSPPQPFVSREFLTTVKQCLCN